ncbi:sodium-dependent nutrient amino acid transporter 1-like [Schistocerca cancellata]|uniref:sodium-dependent nutrient amino acid transporter 1-like n=1 Tax=Schistocerca cancellata TaxID=274614 RepID=UPI002117D2F0|nr:sodium-dependent nutrient amino acid transporter 1-like [Schistocerca cancellata]
MEGQGKDNHAYEGSELDLTSRNQHNAEGTNEDPEEVNGNLKYCSPDGDQPSPAVDNAADSDEGKSLPGSTVQRDQWGKDIEFLMSCIAMSVGLGNIWRFPFVAYENGGGAFLIPYIIVLFLIGRPMYYLEMVVGQFSNYGSIKLWRLCPAFRGVGVGQLFANLMVLCYYCSLLALTTFYFVMSFNSELPWSRCRPEWGDICFDSVKGSGNNTVNVTGKRSSSELYFLKFVLNEPETLDEGIGVPDWRLVLGSLFSWSMVALVVLRGVKSSGKASYFLALFPYVILITLLVRGATLEGAVDGILFFITPQWEQLANPNVWYAAVTQCFFSLSMSFGTLVMLASYNNFKHNIYRDAMIVTLLDTFTSLLAGFTIFSILGNLAYEMGVDDISGVVRSGTGLAFISYPDAIAKFDAVPQLFAVLFFFMLFVLGIGSVASMANCIITVICDQVPSLKYWAVAITLAVVGFLIGLVYITRGGQWILNLVDHYGVTLVVYVLATMELVAICWIYGVDRICQDIYFMLGRKTGIYWRLCWGFITPIFLMVVLIYSLVTNTLTTYGGKLYPDSAYAAGWVLFAFGVVQFPLWMALRIFRKRNISFRKHLLNSFRPSKKWGPRDRTHKEEWDKLMDNWKMENANSTDNVLKKFSRKLFNLYSHS